MPVTYNDKKVVCPYYQHSRSKQSFACEAFFQPGTISMWFESMADKERYMQKFCCSMEGWKTCTQALVLNTIYDYDEEDE